MCGVDDCEPSAFSRIESPVARKPHRCHECRRTIQRGEQYQRFTCENDGSVVSHKACSHCAASQEWLLCHCGGWVTGVLLEELEEHWEEGHRDGGLARLIVGIRRGWSSFGSEALMRVPQPASSVRAGGDHRARRREE